MEQIPNDYSHIKGWGVDADPKNEPTYPMKKYTGDDHNRLNWERPSQQPANVEILKSNERPYVTAVFGTSTPPSGVSGAIRRFAFRFSESSYGHWLPLVIADRVNMVEGIIDDIKKGHFPNIFAERGWGAEVKLNAKELTKNIIVGTIIASALLSIMCGKKKSKR